MNSNQMEDDILTFITEAFSVTCTSRAAAVEGKGVAELISALCWITPSVPPT